MASDDDSGKYPICCIIILFLAAISYVSQNWSTISLTIPRFLYVSSIIIVLGVIFYQLYQLTGKLSHSPLNVMAIVFAAVLIAVIFVSGLSLGSELSLSNSSQKIPQVTYVSTTIIETKISTTIPTKTPVPNPTTNVKQIGTSTTTTSTTNKGSSVTTKLYSEGVTEYVTPVKIVSFENIEEGDISQMAKTDPRYDKGHAYLIERINREKNEVLIMEIIKFGNSEKWYIIDSQNSRLITFGGLSSQYPYIIGHTSIQLPMKCWVCIDNTNTCSSNEYTYKDC